MINITKPLILIFFLIFSDISYAEVMSVDEVLELEKQLNTRREYTLKGAFLRYVSFHITWPEVNNLETKTNICVLGKVPSIAGLNVIHGRRAKDKIINVQYLDSLEEALIDKKCQIIYTLYDEKDKLLEIIKQTTNKPWLTFGNKPGFAEEGGAMNFDIINNRMAITINIKSTKASDLLISNRLFKVVTIIPKI